MVEEKLEKEIFCEWCKGEKKATSKVLNCIWKKFFKKVFYIFKSNKQDDITAEQNASDLIQDVFFEFHKKAINNKIEWKSENEFYSYVWTYILRRKTDKLVSIQEREKRFLHLFPENEDEKESEIDKIPCDEKVSEHMEEFSNKQQLALFYQGLIELEKKLNKRKARVISFFREYLVINLIKTIPGGELLKDINIILDKCIISEFRFLKKGLYDYLEQKLIEEKLIDKRDDIHQIMKHLRPDFINFWNNMTDSTL